MTDVAFHFGAPDKVVYAVRLLRKAVGTGARLLVLADTDTLQRLDVALWGDGSTDFLPHCFANAPAQALALSSVVLADDGLGPGGAPLDVLVNLGAAMPHAFDRHPRVIEVVSLDEDDRMQARKRWRSYTAQGFAIDRKDLNLRS